MDDDRFERKGGFCGFRGFPEYYTPEEVAAAHEAINSEIAEEGGYAFTFCWGDHQYFYDELLQLGMYDAIKHFSIYIMDVSQIPKIIETLNSCGYPFRVALHFPNEVDLKMATEILSTIEDVEKYVVLKPQITCDKIMTVDKDYRKYLKYISPELLITDRYMDYEDILGFVDQMAEELAGKGLTHIQMILLLDKYFQEHFNYPPKGANLGSERHDVGYILSTGHGVCNGFAGLAQMILSHPSIGVETRMVHGEKHAWLEIKIDDKWYSYDFAANLRAKEFFIIRLNDVLHTMLVFGHSLRLVGRRIRGLPANKDELLDMAAFRREREGDIDRSAFGYTFVDFGGVEAKNSPNGMVPVSSGVFFMPRLTVLEHFHGIRHESLTTPLPTAKGKRQSETTTYGI